MMLRPFPHLLMQNIRNKTDVGAVCILVDAGTWTWQSIRTNATTDVFLAELREATWYELKMKACNSAGCGNQSSQFATLDYDGSE